MSNMFTTIIKAIPNEIWCGIAVAGIKPVIDAARDKTPTCLKPVIESEAFDDAMNVAVGVLVTKGIAKMVGEESNTEGAASAAPVSLATAVGAAAGLIYSNIRRHREYVLYGPGPEMSLFPGVTAEEYQREKEEKAAKIAALEEKCRQLEKRFSPYMLTFIPPRGSESVEARITFYEYILSKDISDRQLRNEVARQEKQWKPQEATDPAVLTPHPGGYTEHNLYFTMLCTTRELTPEDIKEMAFEALVGRYSMGVIYPPLRDRVLAQFDELAKLNVLVQPDR